MPLYNSWIESVSVQVCWIQIVQHTLNQCWLGCSSPFSKHFSTGREGSSLLFLHSKLLFVRFFLKKFRHVSVKMQSMQRNFFCSPKLLKKSNSKIMLSSKVGLFMSHCIFSYNSQAGVQIPFVPACQNALVWQAVFNDNTVFHYTPIVEVKVSNKNLAKLPTNSKLRR